MIDKSEILIRLRDSKSELNKFGVSLIGLFGSVIRNEAHKDSDIDILLDFNSDLETFENYMKTCNYLEEIFKEYKSDIIYRKRIKSFY